MSLLFEGLSRPRTQSQDASHLPCVNFEMLDIASVMQILPETMRLKALLQPMVSLMRAFSSLRTPALPVECLSGQCNDACALRISIHGDTDTS